MIDLGDRACWPLAMLGDALDALARQHGLGARDSESDDGGDWPPITPSRLDAWLGWAGEQIGIEALPVSTDLRDLPMLIAGGGPAILRVRHDGQERFLALCGASRRGVRLLTPAHGVIIAGRDAVFDLMSRDLADGVRGEVARVVEAAGVAPQRRERVTRAMVGERIATEVLHGIYLLRLPATADFRKQVTDAGIPSRLVRILAIFALLYLAEIWGWKVIGGSTLSGRLDWGWMTAWLMVMLTMIPWRLLGTWHESLFAIETGRLVKSRLLAGAMALPIDTVKRSGVGQLISQVMESQAFEGLVLGGGFAVLIGAMELGFSAWVLGMGAAPRLHLALLGLFTALTILCAWGFHRTITAWTTKRLGLTHYLVEAMVGHRTRLAQERPDRREANEDSQLASYVDRSEAMDRATVRLGNGLSLGWSLAALAAFAPALAGATRPAPALLAISLGGIMLAQRGLGGIGGGLSSLSRAIFAWRRVSEVFRAGVQPPRNSLPFSPEGSKTGTVIEARNLRFAHGRDGPAVLAGADIALAHGDRVLIEGPSGGGKSTLASLLTGQRTPDGGLLLLDGLDRPTLGDDWQRRVTSSPQFHENHVFTGTLAFNLLMGRQWPPCEADLQEAEDLCRELGLGDLIDRMPGGLHQRVGETGWQLSHGERSRVFLARALLQEAQVTILDESFASLDPATMDKCLNTALAKAQTLVVIAHP